METRSETGWGATKLDSPMAGQHDEHGAPAAASRAGRGASWMVDGEAPDESAPRIGISPAGGEEVAKNKKRVRSIDSLFLLLVS